MFGLLLGIAIAAFFPKGLYSEEKAHIVQKGDTLYSIARVFGIKADDLMKYNGITDPGRILAGQRLKIPSSEAAGMGTGGFVNYKAVRGDTLYSIARKFSVTVGAIQEANRLPQNYMLREGDSLRIPQEARISQEAGAAAATNQNPPSAVQQSATKAGQTSALITSVRWPVSARELSYMTGKLSGVVITGEKAEPVISLTSGTVLSAGPYRGFGRVVIVQVDGGYLYVYGGLESLSVKEGDKIGPGAVLGKLGMDTVSNKPQLFFMVYRSNAPLDPAKAPRA
jgi:murein DD-endopeptidase MepM/ murein hydrolase activator NlpD